jgi:hypothetical protein
MDKRGGSPRTDGASATTKPDQRVEGDDYFGEMMAQAFRLELTGPVSAIAAPPKRRVKRRRKRANPGQRCCRRR